MEYTKENLINEYPTPFYAFDLRVLKDRCLYLKEHLPKGIKLCYAMKANPFVTAYMQDYIDKYEICSPGELRICLEQGLPVNKFVISGVYKNKEDIENLISLSFNVDCYTVESITQYQIIKDIAQNKNEQVTLMLRLTSSNQFGLTKEEIEYVILDTMLNPLIRIKGIQFYSGTQKSSLSKVQREIKALDEFIRHLYEDCNFKITELEYGVGIPVSYFEPNDFDEGEYLNGLSDILNSINSEVNITLEIGRALVASCGTYVTSVVDRKTNSSGNYAIVDGGIHHIVYYGQVMAMKKPSFEILPSRDNEADENWNICGSLCTVNDILLKNISVNTLELNDRLVFKNTGAYCVTEGISLFLSRALPSVVLIDEDGNVDIAREHKEIYSLNY